MNLFPLFLILLSSVMHAGWNALARRGGGEVTASYFSLSLLTILAVGAVPAIWCEVRNAMISREAWILLVSSGVCCGVYLIALSKAYKREELNVAYPIARAIPVVLVGISDIFFHRPPTILGWIGMFVVVIGCLVVALRREPPFRFSTLLGPSTIALLGAALGTTGYSILDNVAAELIVAGPKAAAVYCYFFFAVGISVYLLGSRQSLPGRDQIKREFVPVLTGAALNFGAYWLVLWAYQLTSRAGYVVACRQFSIVIGVLMAAVFLRERVSILRWLAVGSITIGLVILSVWGK